MSDDHPYDHNGECRYCDEQGMHRADCPWLLDLQTELTRLRTELVQAQQSRDTPPPTPEPSPAHWQCLYCGNGHNNYEGPCVKCGTRQGGTVPSPSPAPTLTRYFADWRNPDGWYKPADVDALLRAHEAQRKADDLSLQAVSIFVRDVIEALGAPQPPEDARVNLPEIAMQVVGQIEELKVALDAKDAFLRAREQALWDIIAEMRENDLLGLAYWMERLGQLLTGPETTQP